MERHLKKSHSEIILNLLHLSQNVNAVYLHCIAIQPREKKKAFTGPEGHYSNCPQEGAAAPTTTAQ